jgi:arsenate reductase
MYQYVVTVCDESSSERCPIFPGVIRQRMHWSFEDPAGFQGSHDERLAKTRVVRDQIKAKIEDFIKTGVADAKR